METGKAAGDIQRRLQILRAAEAAVLQPVELWDHGRVRVYLRRTGEDYVVAVFAPANGEVRTYFITRKIQ